LTEQYTAIPLGATRGAALVHPETAPGSFADKPRLRATDPEIADLVEAELRRQEETLELIPSENLASAAVLEALGSWLNNKYAEGVPGKRYYGGCQVVDQVEDLCRTRARELFGAEHANVQPHSGSQANQSVYAAVLQPGDTVLGMALDQGGHLTHGSPVNFSGRLYHFEPYFVSEATGRLDMEEVRRRAEEVRPKLILAGYSSYPRFLDFAAFREIADSVGAPLMVDMAHFAGLVAGGAHPSPVPHSDFVTFTTHKTLRGPWGGVILCRAQYAEAIDKSVFPGNQGGPLLHAIAAKAVMFHQCAQPEFRTYARQVVANAAALARALVERGCILSTGGTDNHLMVIDLRPFGLRGRAVQSAFDAVGITLNANVFPGHGGSPFNPNGVRLGTPAVTTRGMREREMEEIADLIHLMLSRFGEEEVRAEVRRRSLELCRRFPLPYRTS
jgi:glycine hydroxymethyltransferase